MSKESPPQEHLGVEKMPNLPSDTSSLTYEVGRHGLSQNGEKEVRKDVDSPSVEPKDCETDSTKPDKKGFTLLMTVMALALSMFLVSLNPYRCFEMFVADIIIES